MAKALPENKIVVGDCIDMMKAWPEASVDLVFADPPYNIGYAYKLNDAGLASADGAMQYDDRLPADEYVAWTEDWVSAAARLLKPTGSMYVLIGDEYAAEVRIHLKRLERRGLLAFRNWIIWHYTFGQNCRSKFNRSHAHLFYCVGPAVLKKSGKPRKTRKVSGPAAPLEPYKQVVKVGDEPFAFNRQEVSVKSARQTTYNDARANPTGKLPDDTWYLRPQEAVDGAAADGNTYFAEDGDTWTMSRLCGTFKERVGWHPCQLPEAMLERVIKLSSNAGDLVFDPFTGSGTTLAVAARLGRRYLGCELSSEYAGKARERVKHVVATGDTMETTLGDKGIVRGKPKKKAEPKRSPRQKRATRS
ncbi:MAG: site-specific DNA-methyltransferase [Planctomycetota bacterium]